MAWSIISMAIQSTTSQADALFNEFKERQKIYSNICYTNNFT
uniref:Uncharacterized protein n=1 Tax=Rhizophora mucronata TaxID=61149 RepID=A0A2P2LKE8_RHIMU